MNMSKGALLRIGHFSSPLSRASSVQTMGALEVAARRAHQTLAASSKQNEQRAARRLPPPSDDADDNWRSITGCLELPRVMRERALALLRRTAGKERIGLAKMVARHRPEHTADEAGLPFTRDMYSAERAPEGDSKVTGATLVAERLTAFYASSLRPLIELRKRVPDFVPRTVLLHGAGIGAAAFAVRAAWPDDRPEMVIVEPHPEFSRIGQELTSGMIGLTWRGVASAPTSTPHTANKRPGGARSRSPRPETNYGELDLGSFSSEEARRVAEEVKAARAEADNPYARAGSAKARAALTSTEAATKMNKRPSWDLSGVEEEDSAQGGGGVQEESGHRDAPAAATGAAATSGPITGVPKGGWDLILTSYAFAEKDVDASKTGHAQHANEARQKTEKEVRQLWKDCGGCMVVVEAGTPRGFAKVELVRRMLIQESRGDCTPLAPCPHAGPCPLARSSSTFSATLVDKPPVAARAQPDSGIPKWCHFTQRISLPQFQKTAEGGAKDKAYIDWKFSFVALCRKHLAPRADSARHAAIGGALEEGGAGGSGDGEGGRGGALEEAAPVKEGGSTEQVQLPGRPEQVQLPKGSSEEQVKERWKENVNWGRVVRWPMKRTGHVILGANPRTVKEYC